jgi:hypothetical protein
MSQHFVHEMVLTKPAFHSQLPSNGRRMLMRLSKQESPLDRKGSDLWLSDDVDLPDPPSYEPLTCASGELPPWNLIPLRRHRISYSQKNGSLAGTPTGA